MCVFVCVCPAGLLEYRHEKGEPGGSVSFRFDLVDPDGNKLLAQPFIISVLGTSLGGGTHLLLSTFSF